MQPSLFPLHARMEDEHWWFRARRRIMRALVLDLFDDRTNRSVTALDIGCGTGANVAALADRFECVGIDPSPDAIELARRRFPGIPFLCGVAPNDALDTCREADLVLMMDVLEHVEHDAKVFASIVDVAKPGSTFFLTVPADSALWSEHDVTHGHYRRYDANGFRALWASLPVAERLLSHYNSRLYPLVRAARTVNRMRGHSSGAAGTDLAIPPTPIGRVLEEVFSGERVRLRAALRDGSRPGYRRGVSLLAILQRI
jgi:SAM-dependent methyltransferase